MDPIIKELTAQLNMALELEHAARNQYLSHAEILRGEYSEKVIERLKEIASDEAKHQDMLRDLIGNYLFGVPSMCIAETHCATKDKQILETNLKDEKHAIDVYKGIYRKVVENKEKMPYIFEKMEHQIRHIIMDEEEHVAELSLLLGL